MSNFCIIITILITTVIVIIVVEVVVVIVVTDWKILHINSSTEELKKVMETVEVN